MGDIPLLMGRVVEQNPQALATGVSAPMRVCLLIPRLGEETCSLFFCTSFKTSSPIPGDPVLRVAGVQGGWEAGKFRGGRRALVT